MFGGCVLPISFMCFGVILFLVLFGGIRFNVRTDACILVCSLLFSLVSYFTGELSFSYLSINMFSTISLILFLIFCFRKYTFVLNDFIIIFLSLSIYFFISSDNLSFLINYNATVGFVIVLFAFLLYQFNFYKALSVVLSETLLITLISSKIEIDNYGFSLINLNFVFNVLLIFIMLNLLYLSIKKLKFSKDVFYEKDVFVNSTCANSIIIPTINCKGSK